MTKGKNLLTKPNAPKKKDIQVATVGEYIILVGRVVSVVDKNYKEYDKYIIQLKQYTWDLAIFNSELEKCFSLLTGQCSPSMEKFLSGEK